MIFTEILPARRVEPLGALWSEVGSYVRILTRYLLYLD